MSLCPDCRQEVSGGASAGCTRTHFQLAGRPVPRVRRGDERRPALWYSDEEFCDDCGVEVGGYHHRDCAIEQCPICGDFAAVCHCWGLYRS